MSQPPKVVLKAGREKSLKRRHPWIFSGAVERVQGAPAPGDSVEVCSRDGRFLARASFSPASQIRLRTWTFDPDEQIDRAFFRRRLMRAIESRRALGMIAEGSACRVVFGESDGLPGLIVDRYGGFLVCQFLAIGAERWRRTLVELLVELLEPEGVFERSESAARRKEGLASRRGVLAGREPPDVVRLPGLPRLVDVKHGQKTGAYLDQQQNLRSVAGYAGGADVLDAFAYAGSFSIGCLQRGAASATLIDASAEALRMAVLQAELEGVAACCRPIEGDVFTVLRGLRDAGRRFGMVILDPPKFVHSADQLKAGVRGYKDINLLGLQLVEPGGVLATFSCSGHAGPDLFQKVVAGSAVDAGRTAQILASLGQPPDHPVGLSFPEAAYLKGLVLRVF